MRKYFMSSDGVLIGEADEDQRLAVTVGLNFRFIPRYGIEGAGMTTFMTESFVAIGAGLVLARRGVIPFRGKLGLFWLAGPLLFFAAAWISAQMRLQ